MKRFACVLAFFCCNDASAYIVVAEAGKSTAGGVVDALGSWLQWFNFLM